MASTFVCDLLQISSSSGTVLLNTPGYLSRLLRTQVSTDTSPSYKNPLGVATLGPNPLPVPTLVPRDFVPSPVKTRRTLDMMRKTKRKTRQSRNYPETSSTVENKRFRCRLYPLLPLKVFVPRLTDPVDLTFRNPFSTTGPHPFSDGRVTVRTGFRPVSPPTVLSMSRNHSRWYVPLPHVLCTRCLSNRRPRVEGDFKLVYRSREFLPFSASQREDGGLRGRGQGVSCRSGGRPYQALPVSEVHSCPGVV